MTLIRQWYSIWRCSNSHVYLLISKPQRMTLIRQWYSIWRCSQWLSL